MERLFPILKKCALFTDIKEAQYKSLLTCIQAYTKTYQTNDYVFLIGEEINYVGIVLSGSLELRKENAAGLLHILDFVGPSQIFGEGIVCTKARISPVLVRVKEPSEILFIPYKKIITTCSNSCNFHVQIIQNMMLILGEKNHILNQKIELLTLKGMREKLATYLLLESKKQHSSTFQIVPNRNELANFLNVARTSMCRELARMKEEGLIDYYQNSFQILAKESLSETLLS